MNAYPIPRLVACRRRGAVLLCASVLLLMIGLAHGAEMPAVIDRPDAGDGPTKISTGIWIVDITNIDDAQQSFTAELAIVLRWRDPRLAHNGSGVVRYPVEQVWHPRLAIVNETNSVSRKFPDIVEVDPNGTVNYRQRYAGAFTQPLRLKSFPFDRQSFSIQLVAVRYGLNEIMFVPDQDWIDSGITRAAGIAPSVTLPDWTLEKWETKSSTYSLTPGKAYSSYVFEFTASRNVQHYLWKVILPLVLIVIMSWGVFWITPTDPGPQITIAVTSMLTLIAYRFSIDTQLPRLSYTTSLDAFILMSTVLVFFSFVEVLVTTMLETQKRTRLAKAIDRYSRIVFPVIFLLASLSIFAHPRG